MNGRWQRVEDIFHRALEIAPDARSAFLDEASGSDQSIRREVESLLAYESEGGSTFAGTPEEEAPRTIAHYRITEKLGQGGMGTVYRAIDTKLDREVAIKILPRGFAEDAGRMARFTREAKVLASLNHPNIAQIFGVEDRALVMELVPGETLKRPLPIETALGYARQIAEALEAAHEKGIVHRDLKPANIMITPEGVVKLLDFGLASVAPGSPSAADNPMNSPTLTVRTGAGMIMGTAAYMSPEQAAGKPVDKRADVWPFGVILFESLTGRRLFEGATVSLTLAEVLRGPIDFDKLPRETPAPVRGLLRRCLDRDVKNRLRDIGEARVAIDAALSGETPGDPVAQVRRVGLHWGVAAALALGLAIVSFLHFNARAPIPAAPVRFEIPAPANDVLAFDVSPDGRKIAYLSAGKLWIHSLESGVSREVTDKAGTPFWSADSRFVGYRGEGKVKKIAAAGGPPQILADAPGPWTSGAWSRDDVIIWGDRQVGLYRMPAAGGVPVQITALDPARQEKSHHGPKLLPDGRHFFYLRASADEAKSGIYLGSIDVTPQQQSTKRLVASHWQPGYAASVDPGLGYLLFMQEGALMAQPFDNRRLELTGQAEPVVEGVGDNAGGHGAMGYYSASANDVLVYRGKASTDQLLTWYDRDGKILGTVGEPGFYGSLALSPDGARAAVMKWNGSDASNIWLLDLVRGGGSARLTFGSLKDAAQQWSPDGKRLVFGSNRDGPYNLYLKAVDGAQHDEALLVSGVDKLPDSWSPDGRWLLYAQREKTRWGVWVLPLDQARKPVPFLVSEFNEHEACFSPDGRWVSYTSNESGRDEVYVRSFSMNPAGTAVEAGGKWLVSSGGGSASTWRGDSREIFYGSPDDRVVAVEIATSPVFRAGTPRLLGLPPNPIWDSAPDGKRFLAPAAKSGPQPLRVVMNWQSGLKK